MESEHETNLEKVDYVTEEDIKRIVVHCGFPDKQFNLENYTVHKASNKMLGFLSDYWKIQVIVSYNGSRENLSFFVKAISRSNAAKAAMAKEMKFFEKEFVFYTAIKIFMETSDPKPWGARLITSLHDAMVFQDLSALDYKIRNKFERFDRAHTLQALRTLSRFHASSIIFEEKRRKLVHRVYSINEEFEAILSVGGYKITDPWFVQCMNGALETVKHFSRYRENHELMSKINSCWEQIWSEALQLSNFSSKYRNVICHRDLWNNNILFHYEKVGVNIEPDDCMLVDFQAVRCQPPAGDVMLLLYCNLDPKFREENMTYFLNYYYQELNSNLRRNEVDIKTIITREQFAASAEEQRLWAVVVCACLIPQFWIDDDLTTDTFSDTAQFDEILSKDKASFISKMIKINQDYKKHVLEIFDEIVERYCIQGSPCK